MKPVELEIIMRDSTRQGMQSVEGNVEALNSQIERQNALIHKLETDLRTMQAAFEKAGRAGDQTENIAMIAALRKEVANLKGELSELEKQQKQTSSAPVVPPVAASGMKEQIAEVKANIKYMEDYVKQYEKSMKNMAPGKEKALMTQELEGAKAAILAEKEALVQLEQQAGKSGQKQTTLRTQIAQLKQEMSMMTEGTEEYRMAMERLGQLQDQYGDIATQGRIFADDNKDIKAAMDAVSGLSGAMTAGVGVASLFGMEEEKLAQIQTKLQAVMAITMGVQQVANTLNKDSYFTKVLLVKADNLLTAANTRLTVSLGISNVAAKALMATLTLGVSVAIGGLIWLWDTYTDKQDKAKKSQEEATEAAKKLAEAEDELRKSAAGSVSAQLLQYKKLQAAYKELGDDMRKKEKFIKDNKKAFDELGIAVGGVKEAEDLLINGEEAFLKIMNNRALIAASMELAAGKYKDAIAKMMEVDAKQKKATGYSSKDLDEDDRTVASRSAANKVHQLRGGNFLEGISDEDMEAKLTEYAKTGNKFYTQALAIYNKEKSAAIEEVTRQNKGALERNAEEERKNVEKFINEGAESIRNGTKLTKENKDIFQQAGFTPTNDNKKDKPKVSMDDISAAELKARQKIEAMKIALTQEGAAKEKAEARARFDAELARIDAEEKERKEALAKAKKAGLPVSEEQVATVTDQSGKQRKGATDIYIKEFFDIEKKSAEQEKALWNEVNLHFASGLDQRLAEIDHHYDEQVKKAKGNKELIDALNRNRETDKDVETKNTKLDSIDNAEQIELQRQAIATQGLNMDELVEQQRTDILLKYARQRIAILATMTDERSQQEKAQLEVTVEGLEKDKKKPKSVKGLFDEKAMNSLIKHYQKLGSSEEEATEKAQEFATTFQGRMQTASEVVGGLKSAFGGLDEGLDKAMDAVGSVVDGFANGGMVGGIAAAAGQVISITAGLIGAKKEMDASMVANYETWMEAMNDLIDKQISLLDQLGGDKFGANIKKTTEDISKQIAASRKLLGEAASAGSSAGSHSYGYRMNRMLRGYKDQLREVGIYTQDWSQMTDDQLVKLREIPDLWAHVPEEMRKYIEALAEGKEKMEEFKQTVQDTVLGFDFSDITSMIVDSMTDSSIDNALGTLVENVDGAIATIVKNMLARNMLVGPIQKMVSTLMTSMTKTKIENGQEVTYYDLEAEAAKNFTDGVTSLGSEYKKAYDKLKEQFAAAGIDFDGPDKDKTTQQSGHAGAITTVTEETAGKLEGIGNSIQTHIISMDDKMTDISQCAYEAIGVLGKIAENTAYCKYLEQLADDSAYQRREGTKMR